MGVVIGTLVAAIVGCIASFLIGVGVAVHHLREGPGEIEIQEKRVTRERS